MPRPERAGATGWWDLFADEQETRRRSPALILATVGALVTVAAGVIGWLAMPSSSSGSANETSRAPATPIAIPPNAVSEDRLLHLLPTGYDPSRCTPVAPAKAVVAKVTCHRDDDPAGRTPATFTMVRDNASLKTAFDTLVQDLSMVSCPGNILSPGPWHSNDTPQQSSGTLVCGFQNNIPTVAWTTDRELLVSCVQADPRRSTLDDLYRWWTSQ